jgi:hypothetical protein
MRPRLPGARPCAAYLLALSLTALAGCQVNDGGLTAKIGGPKVGDKNSGDDEVTGTVPTTVGPTVDAAPTPPSVPADAGMAPPEPDAAPLGAGPDASPPPVGAMPPECAQPLELPLAFTSRREVPDSDDFTFDNDGYFLARAGRDIARLAYGGAPQMVVRNVVGEHNTIDSLRVLPGGDIVFADYMGDALVRIDDHGKARKLANLRSPNKLAFGPAGHLYVVGIEGEIYLADPDSGKTTQIGKVDGRLRGLTFSLDYKTLYVSDARNDVLHSLALRPDGTVETPRVWARNLGGGPDGMTTDACGFVYVADHSDANLRRVSPSGTVEVVAKLGGPTSSVGFGSGRQGWDANTLYTVTVERGGTYEIKVGVPAAPPPAP